VNFTSYYFQEYDASATTSLTVSIGIDPTPPYSPGGTDSTLAITIGVLVGGIVLCVIVCVVIGVYCGGNACNPQPQQQPIPIQVQLSQQYTPAPKFDRKPSDTDVSITRMESIQDDGSVHLHTVYTTKAQQPTGYMYIYQGKRYGDGLHSLSTQIVEFYPLGYSPENSPDEVIRKHIHDLIYQRAISDISNILADEYLLGREEMILIYIYTYEGEDPFYRKLNAAMRAGDVEALKPFRDYIYYLTKTLEKIPPSTGVTSVYRGIDCKLDNYREGTRIVWPSFSSSTLDANVAVQFMKGQKGTLFLINAKTPRLIERYSALKNEQEVLFLPNSKFIIKAEHAGSSKNLMGKLANVCLDNITILELDEIE